MLIKNWRIQNQRKKFPVFCSLENHSNMKYRLLNQEELLPLEADFIKFLSAQGISSDLWIRMKKQSPDQVNELIADFSDGVWESILQRIEYLEFRSPKDIKTFHCLAEKIALRGLQIDGTTDFNFLTDEVSAGKLIELQQNGVSIKIYRAEKVYQQNDRNLELFGMIENGAIISPDGNLFQALGPLQS
jgi:hypothetical protein